MGTIYFDNAATSWPKPPEVLAAIADCLAEAGGNPGRSGHRLSIAAARVVEDARELLAALFNAGDPSRIVFTQNATHALNLALYGLLRPGDRVVTTSVEHNSVMRPLRHLETQGAFGIGQSSWGPTGFAFGASETQANQLAAAARRHPNGQGLDIRICAGLNRGAEIAAQE